MSVPLAPPPSIRTCWPSNCSGFLFLTTLYPSLENLQPVIVTVNQISFISVEALDFWNHRIRVVTITNLGKIESEKIGQFSETRSVQPYHNSLIRGGWSLPGLKLLRGHLPTLLAWNNSLHLKFCHKSTIPNLSASIPECWIGWIYEGGGLLHTVPGTQAPVWVAGSFIQFCFNVVQNKKKTYNGFALPLNDEGMILAGWQRGNLGKPSPTIIVRFCNHMYNHNMILATSFGRFVVRFWYMLECLHIRFNI